MRLVKRLLRPLLAPIFFRILSRIRYAVDSSNTGDTIQQMHAATQRIDVAAHGIDATKQAVDAAAHGISATKQAVDAATHGIEAVARRIEALANHLNQVTHSVDQAIAASDQIDQRVAALAIQAEIARRELNELRSVSRPMLPLGDAIALATDDGHLFIPGDSEALLGALLDNRSGLKPGVRAMVRSLLEPGDVMIDCRAGFGSAAFAAARTVGPQGRVLALEPSPRLAALLRRAVRFNDVPWIEVEDLIAGDAEGSRRLSAAPHTAIRPLDALIPPGQPVAVVRTSSGQDESTIWRGMQRLVSDNPALALIAEGDDHLDRTGEAAHTAWLEALKDAGFALWAIANDGGLAPAAPLNSAQDLLALRQPLASRGLIAS